MADGHDSPPVFASNDESEEWISRWKAVCAKDLIDSPVFEVDADTAVEDACEALLSNDTSCLAIRSRDQSTSPYLGLFDFADVNAFLKLAATQHTMHPDELQDNPRVGRIIAAAKAGKVPVEFVSNLSEKNPLHTLPNTSTIVELLELFSRGAHRVLIMSSNDSDSNDNYSQSFVGLVTDRSLLSYFHSQAPETPALQQFLSSPLQTLSLPSFSLRAAVVFCSSRDTVLDAMRKMSDEGVSSVAVLEDAGAAPPVNGALLSAVSVTDIGRIVVPAQSKQVLSMPLHQFISQIKAPDGFTDGADRYPVYSVSAGSTLRYTIEKILATTAHRVFVTEDSAAASPSSSSVLLSTASLHLRGVVSIVDLLSLFARLANLDVDPTRMQRHRRASSASTSSRSSRSAR
ncbi:hypothetical protein BD410DRAFT_769560 [Rickenella mellea]|uniref:CBS domain-containing protein n=1 Tax=Rickenella mellea TaxID=50990 RepID=A0A4Y7Q5U8_9AGAM|nr:hypothetical protein BD410DRAFT_769560 [Rickenella mellea]